VGNVIGEGDMKAQIKAVYTDLKETLAAHGASDSGLKSSPSCPPKDWGRIVARIAATVGITG
jgi:hypothetical protein